MNIRQLRDFIVVPVLTEASTSEHNLCTDSAVTLLIGTCIQESSGGEYIRQIGFDRGTSDDGGYGIYQAELKTAALIIREAVSRSDRSTIYRQLMDTMHKYSSGDDDVSFRRDITGNLYYATLLCRLHYLLVPQPLPEATDIFGLAQYWKRHYNTESGKGTVSRFIFGLGKIECE